MLKVVVAVCVTIVATAIVNTKTVRGRAGSERGGSVPHQAADASTIAGAAGNSPTMQPWTMDKILILK